MARIGVLFAYEVLGTFNETNLEHHSTVSDGSTIIASNKSYVYEIKKLDAPADAPPSDVYQWCLVTDNKLQKLQFKAMNDTSRTFQADQFLDMTGLTFDYNGQTVKISTASEEAIAEILTFYQ